MTTIHGKSVVVNFGFTYPVFARRFPLLNAPLVELAYQLRESKGRPIFFVDVGAAVGDTVLLLYANIPDGFSGFVCIDGDPEFFFCLGKNLGHLPGGRLVHCLLSDSENEVAGLIRTHSGTASAQGNAKSKPMTLSSIVSEEVDLLKVDVDGFDGRVILGALALLRRCRPTVIFEWHPILCRQTSNSWNDHFAALVAEGYNTFLWFTKYGNFSHYMFGYSQREVDAMAEYCLADISLDWHYDVIALHDSSDISLVELAKLDFASKRPSKW
ncbi:FkbM family methyltransferase [Trichloromonas sp.]|uniref:FkbM family methyltransferase n=1 Tax=Trichloromonas sp. TaxID=3069249 RepID=UPI002A3EF262|nr:FkbM family methyltransferase [Trichloromonas sp.]